MKRQHKTLDCIIKKARFVTYLSSWKDASVGLPQVQVVQWNIKELPFNLLYFSLSIRSLPFISRCFFFLLSVKFQVIPVSPVFSWHNDQWNNACFDCELANTFPECCNSFLGKIQPGEQIRKKKPFYSIGMSWKWHFQNITTLTKSWVIGFTSNCRYKVTWPVGAIYAQYFKILLMSLKDHFASLFGWLMSHNSISTSSSRQNFLLSFCFRKHPLLHSQLKVSALSLNLVEITKKRTGVF